jgi:hypothetical protein
MMVLRLPIKFRSIFFLLWKQDLFIRKDVVQIGLEKEFWKRPWWFCLDRLTDEGLDRKIVLRSDTYIWLRILVLLFNVWKIFRDWRNGLHCW